MNKGRLKEAMICQSQESNWDFSLHILKLVSVTLNFSKILCIQYIIIRCLSKIINLYCKPTRVKGNMQTTRFLIQVVYHLVGKTGSTYKKSNKVIHKSYHSSGVRPISGSRERSQETIKFILFPNVIKNCIRYNSYSTI